MNKYLALTLALILFQGNSAFAETALQKPAVQKSEGNTSLPHKKTAPTPQTRSMLLTIGNCMKCTPNTFLLILSKDPKGQNKVICGPNPTSCALFEGPSYQDYTRLDNIKFAEVPNVEGMYSITFQYSPVDTPRYLAFDTAGCQDPMEQSPYVEIANDLIISGNCELESTKK